MPRYGIEACSAGVVVYRNKEFVGDFGAVRLVGSVKE